MTDQPKNIEEHFGHIASLIGERSRAMILWSLLDGRAYTATELAIAADISFQSASNHLSQLINAQLLVVEKQGRHKYYRFANDRVAHTIENIAGLMTTGPSRIIHAAEPTGIKYARTCYDHLAGKIAVQLTHSLVKNKWLTPVKDRYEISDTGNRRFENMGIDMEAAQKQHRKFAYPCLDWSERNHHLGGALGAALLGSMLQKDWIRKLKHTREVFITGKGRLEMNKLFKIGL